MDNTGYSTTVTGQAAILRYLTGISEQNLPLQIRPLDASTEGMYQSSILRIEEESSQLVLHQIQPGTWQSKMQSRENIEVVCHSAQGTLKFSGVVSPLDDDESSLYCTLSIPEKMSRQQLRSAFRVTTTKYQSDCTLELEDGPELLGSCRDLSLTGARFQVKSPENGRIEKGQHAKHCLLLIADVLQLNCSATIRHVEENSSRTVLLGINFDELEPSQTNSLKAAINKLERMNITS